MIKEMKFLEIRDSATMIPAIAYSLSGGDHMLAHYAGYGIEPYIMLTKLCGPETQYDTYKWGFARTMGAAHRYIKENWSKLKDGDVVDVQFILGETTEPKESDLLINYLDMYRAAEKI